MKAFEHIDINAEGGKLCSARCGPGVRVLDLYDAQVAEPARMPQRVAGRPLNTVSAGSSGKYDFAGGVAPLSYPHVVAALLQSGAGTHHHFGQLPEQYLALIHTLLAHAGIDAARFVYHGNVPSVQRALLAIENPVYVPSFPVGGALMIVEVMSAGVPVLLNANAKPSDSYDFMNASHVSMMPERHLTFTALADIAPALRAIDADYAGFSQSSNAGFERRHSRASFQAGLDRLRI
jgi:hypothetical protein